MTIMTKRRKSKQKIKGKKLPVKQLKNQLARLFSQNKNTRYNAKQALKKLKVI